MAATKPQAGHDIVTTTAVELIGVALFAILAGISDDMGKIVVVLMWGFLLGWLLLHTGELDTLTKNFPAPQSGGIGSWPQI